MHKTPGKPRVLIERLKRLELSTFCMASRRSSQLSYSRAGAEYSPTASVRSRMRSRTASRIRVG